MEKNLRVTMGLGSSPGRTIEILQAAGAAKNKYINRVDSGKETGGLFLKKERICIKQKVLLIFSLKFSS